LLLKQEGVPVCSVELRTRECDGRVVVVLRGELDVTDAASVATALTGVAAREVFSVHACVEDAAGSAGHSGLAPALAAGRPVVLAAT
jgi:hypothetical protein